MCNLYSITTNQAAIIALFGVINRYVGNLAPMPSVFPDYQAPIVRNAAEGRELATARWGMPSSSKALMDATKKRAEKLRAKGKTVDFSELLRMEPDGGTTNIRNLKSKHWTRWLGAENRCVVPFNSFSEFNKAEGGDIWFALDEARPLACFAGIWTGRRRNHARTSWYSGLPSPSCSRNSACCRRFFSECFRRNPPQPSGVDQAIALNS
jgi:putative SOS response-associated peptidase YedK